VLFIPEQSGEGLVVRPMKSFAFMQGFFDFYTSQICYITSFIFTKT
jgi:hypothetical protein